MSDSEQKALTEKVPTLTQKLSVKVVESANLKEDLDETTASVQRFKNKVWKSLSLARMEIAARDLRGHVQDRQDEISREPSRRVKKRWKLLFRLRLFVSRKMLETNFYADLRLVKFSR